tara:strand:- start:344 stop:1621 length:1278 start_codon:yes stop_codon:yes gene_type:complete
MGDFTGKRSKRKQTATMNQMNQMVQNQLQDFQGRRQVAQEAVDVQRGKFEAFDITNPFAGAQNVYAGAKNTYAGLQNQFAGLENMYEGMENRFEDMTVDMRAADFQVQQGQQQRANIMQGLRGAAGTSGVAGLAQAMASQGQLQSQQIAAGISQQERQNQMMAAQEGARIDQLQRGAGMQLQQQRAAGAQQLQAQQAAGAMQQQQMQMAGAAQQQQMILEGEAARQAAEFGRESTLLGMDYGLLAGANQAEQMAMANQMSAMGMKADMYGAQSQNNMFSQLTEAASSAAATKTAFACIPKGISIDTIDGKVLIEDIKPGDVVMGYNGSPVKVLQKHEYLEDPIKERFYKVEFNNGSIVEVCDMHRIRGERAKDITESVKSKEVYSGVEFSYDLLTEDAGYRMNGIPVNSMIEEMAVGIAEIIKNK